MTLWPMKLCPALWLLLAPGMAAAQTGLSAAVVLSGPLAEWKQEIEETGKGKVILARVYTDRQRNLIFLPKDAEQRPILRRYFLNENFVGEFVATEAMNINYEGVEGKFHFILLNMARAADWGNHEDAVLAHELGHVWLYALHYPVPVYEGEPDSCVVILAGDAVQHILIRKEVRQRKIPFQDSWISKLETALDAMEDSEPQSSKAIPVCRLVTQLVLWLDVRLGLSPEAWDKYDLFLEAMERSYAELRPQVDWLCELLLAADVSDPDVHLQVLQEVLVRMYAFADSLAASGRPIR